MCNDPGCIFCRRTKKEVSMVLDMLLIRPIVDDKHLDMGAYEENGESTFTDTDEALLNAANAGKKEVS
jgi:hypothetical protein